MFDTDNDKCPDCGLVFKAGETVKRINDLDYHPFCNPPVETLVVKTEKPILHHVK